MPPPGTGVLSFGLVAIPVRIHTATKSENVSFHLLHEKCGSRVRNQHYCPVCNVVVERADLVRGFQHAKDQYVPVTEEELESLEAEANRSIDLKEFIPLASVDPVYFEDTHYLAAEKGGEKPYRLLADAMAKSGRVAIAELVSRGKEQLVLIRPYRKGLGGTKTKFSKTIRTREARLDLLQLYHSELSPNFKATREARELGRRNYANKIDGTATKLRMLSTLVQSYPEGIMEGQMRAHAGLRKSGTYYTYLSRLKKTGLLEERNNLMYATEAGIAYCGDHRVEAPQTTGDANEFSSLERTKTNLVRRWFNESPYPCPESTSGNTTPRRHGAIRRHDSRRISPQLPRTSSSGLKSWRTLS